MKLLRYSVFVIMVLVTVLLVSAVRTAREAARQSACQGRMNQLQLALRNYEAENGHFPPAFINGPDGTPWHSWRVLLLPYLSEGAVYDEYRLDEPWNGPNNRRLADRIHVELFQCTSGPDRGRTLNTNYVVVVGEETAFPGATTTTSDDIKDGAENTVLLVEIGHSDIHWMEPRDLEFNSLTLELDPEEASSVAISSHHPAGPAVVFADRIAAYRLRSPMRVATLKALLTIAGGEEVHKESLGKWDQANGCYLTESDE